MYYYQINSSLHTLTDHLGSIVALMDENGTVVEETSFGPWWRTRNPQNYNRYAYALNNPLVYTDHTGEWFGIDEIISAANHSGLQGLWTAVSIGGVAGGVGGYRYARQNNLNPWTGRALASDTMLPRLAEISKGRHENRQIRSNVSGDFDIALREWNNIQRQYGSEPPQGISAGFETTLSCGTRVTDQFYYGGNTNPTGYNIRINTYNPPTINKVFPVYIRYNQW